MPTSGITKSRMLPLARSSSRSEKTSTYFSSALVSVRNSAACSIPPLMSVWALPLVSATKSSTLRLKVRFCPLTTLGRASKLTLAMMSFSLKLPLSMRATAMESPLFKVSSR